MHERNGRPLTEWLAELQTTRDQAMDVLSRIHSPELEDLIIPSAATKKSVYDILRETDLAILQCRVLMREESEGASTDLSACGHAQADTAGQASGQQPTAAA